jgi:CHAT domain-containing protein
LIPFSVLLTEPIKVSSKPNLLFGEYQKVPWLIRQFSITRIPSATAFVTLRSIPESNTERNTFIGFGDPIFNLNQLEQAQEKAGSEPIITVALKKKVHVRGIRLTEKGHLDKEQISSCNIGMLNRLPDTREEVLSIADAVGADPATDVFFGKQANEHRVKTMDLGNRRIIIFATHALIPGDLDGLHQPAIALSAPTVTGDDDDGLLTLDEILRLKLNADWVVLSACNTGAADGEGSEAISGLGRAFFYAGTKAILVSMWPVETTSAKRLTTGLFKYQKENPKLSRTQALQKSILSLIDSQGFKDEVSGKIIASYAHPIFWAPFIIVGEGGGI